MRWLIDVTTTAWRTIPLPTPWGIRGMPVAGNFDGNIANGDSRGVPMHALWEDTKPRLQRGHARYPHRSAAGRWWGDFNGDGVDDFGTYNNVTRTFSFDFTARAAGSSRCPSGSKQRPPAGRWWPEFRPRGIRRRGALAARQRRASTQEPPPIWYFLESGGVPIDQAKVSLRRCTGCSAVRWARPVAGNFNDPQRRRGAGVQPPWR